MKCPKCLKEINDGASFCGYCGQAINKEPIQEEPPQGFNEPKNKGIKRKKHIGLKILLAFSVIVIVAGIVLGLLTAKGIVDLSGIIPENIYAWSDFFESPNEESEPETSDETSDDKEQADNASDKDIEKEEITTNNQNEATDDNPLSSRTLIVGVSPDYEPFEYYNNDELAGFDIDLIRLIANELGYEIEFKICDFDKLVSSVSNGDLDLAISAIAIIKEREPLVDFTDVYVSETYEYEGELCEASYAIAVQKNSALKTVLNEQINRLKENGKIQRLVYKYGIG